ncbi:MAG: ABC transporter substrate-binding protein [Planctomycetaceae bacterium]|nr:ABC transporter substrate-binding protein [Planctomycetaceae bacterium]MBT4724966.1 ABC transporter substrate-binding protein [Planctomycetaceae bacterium]MBT5597207.1 ABC transporter substrate-binding protein [Planctomycetaceae bacterium]MBT5884553.1 ABC transporter substrate-binding protein [Planctomycetaceae bacterium]MBT7918518.1 ABC transporter substrate-binding protein [Planctomycetaceae bacterium]
MNEIGKTQIHVGHSPDPDDAFMFYALARDTIDTGKYEFSHELVDIETLNRRAFEADLELTALSLHAYAHLADKYAICACGASMGDKYGPMVVAREEVSLAELNDATIAIPGTLTTAYLALRMCMGVDFKYVVVPFDEILNVVEAGSFEGAEVHAGLIIHEGQLTYASQDLKLVVDLGVWWDEETGLPLPLGCNGIRKDMGEETMLEVTALLKESIVHGLENRAPALDYALGYGRGLDRSMADEFVGMYVNDWTVDFGEKGREAVRLLLKRGFECGVIPELIEPEFVG